MKIRTTVKHKKESHPGYGRGSKMAFAFNGNEGMTLKLVKSRTYIFDVDSPGHPFYFTTDSKGGNGNKGSLMGENESPTDKGLVKFHVRSDLPKTFYYQCQRHPGMGGKVEIVETEKEGNVPIYMDNAFKSMIINQLYI